MHAVNETFNTSHLENNADYYSCSNCGEMAYLGG